ncbi:hypothetical protein RA280_22700 [Cupriavidus sp. CV2]|uniref:hypothetical protein n=1 Tax=Cupriavidus ulmosensis TaxID=3065913 RepID=UPI00296B258C|nr:hypothetical protein [Cupriavidus sp. CV2]MDW3684504.1 hypothetical protein [Cupriavidus sp. CV2]
MAPYLLLAVRAFGVGTIIVIIAVVSRQVYLRVAAEAGGPGADGEPAATMLIRCEAMHSHLQNRHISEGAADANEKPSARSRCMES